MTCLSKTFSFYEGESKDLKLSLVTVTDGCRDIHRIIPMVRASLVRQDLTFNAKGVGADGNAVTVLYTTGAVAGSEVVTVVGNAITVQIATGVSTATQIKAKLDASTAAMALIGVVISGTGSVAQTGPAGASLISGAGDKIEVVVPGTPNDLIFGYNSTPAIQVIDQYLGQIKVALTGTETDQIIDGPVVVNVTDDTGKKKVFVASGGITKVQPQGC